MTIAADPADTKTLVVDAKSGKAAYDFRNNVLGAPRPLYEWGDLFREDVNPQQFSLTKFQMFGWTLVAAAFYIFIFLNKLPKPMNTLPVVDSTVVLLTGLSQAGYLGGKAAAEPPKPSS